MLKKMTVCTTVAAILAGLSMSAHAVADTARAIDVPAGDLVVALEALAKQANIELVYQAEQLRGIRTGGVSGTYDPKEAVSLLLKGTKLIIHTDEATGVILVAPPARAKQDPRASSNTDRSNSLPSEAELEEIIVTAQKRVERLQDVPVPVTAIAAESLVSSNQLRIQDYYTRMPGLSVTMLGDTGFPVLTIRGVSTGGFTNPTVGIVVDDVPFGASTSTAVGSQAPDFDPSELARVEVLRGPQGTLYGASSLGGLLKFVTVDPSTEELSGRVQAGVTSVQGGDSPGYNVRAGLNVPLSETLAFRVSGSRRNEPGYIDDPVRGEEDVNETHSTSGRAALLWRPSDAFAFKLSSLHQDTQRDGEDTAFRSPGFGDLQQSYLIDTGRYDQKLQAHSASMTVKLGPAELTSLTGYSIAEFSSAYDTTPILGNRTNGVFGVRGTQQVVDSETKKFSQEVRLNTPLGGAIDWLLGAFYTTEDTTQVSENRALNETTGEVRGSALARVVDPSFKEYAAFTDLTFKMTDRFDVQLGSRASKTEFTSGARISTGVVPTFLQVSPSIDPVFESDDTAVTYLLTPRFTVSQDLMVYARLSSGYRPGGPNTAVYAANLGLPTEYGPDETWNYEIGVKGSVLDGKVSFDSSVYHIDWKDIQIQLREPVSLQIYFTNAGRAVSEGVELSIEARPFSGLSISAWAAYNDANITDVPPITFFTIREGDRLPYSSPLSGSISVDQEFDLWSGTTGSIGTSISYVDDRRGRFFSGTQPREIFPAYTQLDLHAAIRVGSWALNAFVNNVTNERGVLRAGQDAAAGFPQAFTYIQPRTVGLSLSRTFEN